MTSAEIPTPWPLRRVRRFDITNAAGDVFMRRFFLIKWGWINLYIHHFIRSDEDFCLHDHPWHFITFIVKGGYREICADGPHWRRPGTILFRRSTFRHRVEVDRPAWSIVLIGRKHRAWGFFTKFGWRPWTRGQRPICSDVSEGGDS